MRVKSATIQQVILGIALLLALCWNLAQANEINDLKITDSATGTRAELRLRSKGPFTTLKLANPDRLVVDLADTSVAPSLRMPKAVGAVKAVRHGQPQPGTTRIVFDLTAPIAMLPPRLETDANGTARLVLEWPGDGPAEPIADATKAATSTVAVPATAQPSAPGVAANTAATKPLATAPVTPPPASLPAQAPAAATVSPKLPPTATVATKTQPLAPPVVSPTPSPTPAGATRVAATKVADTNHVAATHVAAANPPATTAKPVADGGTSKQRPTTAKIEPPPLPAGRTLQDLRTGTRPLIIAIDAGHGGQDPGAHGPSGKREKDVTLIIARELAKQINATPGLKAYLTRDSDVFLPLTKRTQLARAAKADMFVSIHADAAENRAARGASVFVLSLRGASSQRARWLADKENAADMIGGVRVAQTDNTLASVLLDLTQSGQMKASESAAAHVLDGLKGIGNTHKPHIERANFAVLRTSDMPAMLVETAFISNPDEERKLFDPEYQRQLALAVLNGVDLYFTRQPPPGTLYAARAKLAQEAPVQVAKAQGSTGGSP